MKKIITFVLLYLIYFGSNGQLPISSTGKFFNYNGTKIYYEDIGQGEPLLLLHTFNGTADQWKAYFEDYSKIFRVISVDMIGHGRSDIYKKGDVEFRHSDYAKIILALLDYLKINQVNAMGASSGGITLFYANFMQPDKFKNVITIGAQIYYDQRVRDWITSDGPDSAKTDIISKQSKIHGQEKAMLQARQFWRFRNFYGDPSFSPDMLNSIKAQWLIVQGDNDFIPLDQAIEMKKYIPNSRLWIFPNGGHVPHLDPNNYSDFLKHSTEFLMGKWSPKK
ncbi:MAG: alpha/beta hydrolase [Cytophagales bacterium]|nr:alpha/beta hydrolase [Cytophagales bacterium]